MKHKVYTISDGQTLSSLIPRRSCLRSGCRCPLKPSQSTVQFLSSRTLRATALLAGVPVAHLCEVPQQRKRTLPDVRRVVRTARQEQLPQVGPAHLRGRDRGQRDVCREQILGGEQTEASQKLRRHASTFLSEALHQGQPYST